METGIIWSGAGLFTFPPLPTGGKFGTCGYIEIITLLRLSCCTFIYKNKDWQFPMFQILVLFPLSDSMIILWKFNNAADPNADIFMEADEIQNKESWTFHKALR